MLTATSHIPALLPYKSDAPVPTDRRLRVRPLPSELGEQQLGVHRADQLAQGLDAGGHDLHRALDLDLAGETVDERADLLFNERLERLAIAQRSEEHTS